jgi:hypothetical protein
MKKSIATITIIMGIFSISPIITSCGSNKSGEQQEQTHDHQTIEGGEMHDGENSDHNSSMASAYACPMHPEITGKKGDKCTICGMALEPVKKN